MLGRQLQSLSQALHHHTQDFWIDSAFNAHLALGQLPPADSCKRPAGRFLTFGASEHNGEQHWGVTSMGTPRWPALSMRRHRKTAWALPRSAVRHMRAASSST